MIRFIVSIIVIIIITTIFTHINYIIDQFNYNFNTNNESIKKIEYNEMVKKYRYYNDYSVKPNNTLMESWRNIDHWIYDIRLV